MSFTMIRSLASVAFVGVLFTTLLANETACSSKTCSSSEESACTNAYTDCTNKAAAAADKAACQKCVDDYCSCYDKCGNSCDKNKLSSACNF
jgi:hypothetical protein